MKIFLLLLSGLSMASSSLSTTVSFSQNNYQQQQAAVMEIEEEMMTEQTPQVLGVEHLNDQLLRPAPQETNSDDVEQDLETGAGQTKPERIYIKTIKNDRTLEQDVAILSTWFRITTAMVGFILVAVLITIMLLRKNQNLLQAAIDQKLVKPDKKTKKK